MRGFTSIDTALGEYYTYCERNNYYDENGNGKFMTFVNENEMDEDELDLELGLHAEPKDCLYTGMDDSFPLQNDINDNSKITREKEIFKIIQHCYLHGHHPYISTPYENNLNTKMKHQAPKKPMMLIDQLLLTGRPKPSITIMDEALKEYYSYCGRDEYVSGMFAKFAKLHGYDDSRIELELGDNADPSDCLLVEFDNHFPVIEKSELDTDQARVEYIFKVLRHCYKHGKHPYETEYKDKMTLIRDEPEEKKSPHLIRIKRADDALARYYEECDMAYKALILMNEGWSLWGKFEWLVHKHELGPEEIESLLNEGVDPTHPRRHFFLKMDNNFPFLDDYKFSGQNGDFLRCE